MERVVFVLFFSGAVIASSFPIEDIDCTTGDEFHPHENCSLFYRCSNGAPILLSCPDGYFFNPQLDICDFPQSVPECQGGTRPPPVPTTSNPSQTTIISTTATYPTTPTPIEERECGQIINETSGHIAYKLNSNYDSYERCAWTISVPGASKYQFMLQQSGFESSDGILITGLRRVEKEVGVDTEIMNETLTVFEVQGNTAIVLFYSNNTISGKGFLLSFSAIDSDQVDQLPEYSENYIFNTSDTGNIQYNRYADYGSYQNNELSTVLHVAAPHNNLISTFLGLLGIYCDGDFIQVLKFQYDIPSPYWIEGEKLRFDAFGYNTYHTDVTLYVLSTDDEFIDIGFMMGFNNGPLSAEKMQFPVSFFPNKTQNQDSLECGLCEYCPDPDPEY